MSELKHCPFCGIKAELAIYYDFYRFHCPDPECEAHLPDGVVVNGIGNWHPSIDDARVAWNRRAKPGDDKSLTDEEREILNDMPALKRLAMIAGFEVER